MGSASSPMELAIGLEGMASGTSASSSLRFPTAQSPVSSENNEKLRSKQLYQYFINDHHNIKKNL